MTLEESLTTHGAEHGSQVMDGMLEDLKGKPLELKRQLSTLGRIADYLIAQDPLLSADAKWWAEFETRHTKTEPTP